MVRFIPKQFAENSTTSVVFGSHQEQGGNPGDGTISSDPATLQGGAAWPLGWSAATDDFFKIPRGEEMEGLERVLSAAIIQQFKDGLTFWQSEMPVTQYQTIVQYQTGSDLPKLYINITGTSTATPPDLDTTNWYMFLDTDASYANVALTNSPYTTNRILEIPQDIKLELNNGMFTLKAGSKVYVPNGFESDGTTPKFDSFTLLSDTGSGDISGISTDYLFFVNSVGGLSGASKARCYSGTVEPTGTDGVFWYDTTNNVVKRHNGTSWVSGYSLPFCVISSGASSIDQIFNGFGYIGSTVFALPGVKCQSSTGRNVDGTCISPVRTVTSVLTYDASVWNNVTLYFLLWTTQCEAQDVRRFTRNKEFSSQSITYSFDENENKWYFSNDSQTWGNSGFVVNIVGKFVIASGKITSFEPYTVDSVLNSNLSNLSAAGQAKFDAKANVSNTVTTDTAQTISGVKTFNANTIVNGGTGNGTFTIKNDVTTYGTSAVDLVVATSNGKNQLLVHFQEGNKWFAYFDQDPSTKNITYSLTGCAAVYVPTPATTANDTQAATTAWFNSKMQVVSALPANPDPNVFYFIPE
jgi:hypothetical protein